MTENELKYGSKDVDIISLQLEMHYLSFIGFCFGNVQKYLKRYFSESKKSKNPDDIIKVLDYINRLELKTDKYIYNGEVIFTRFKRLIDMKEYKVAYIHAIDLQEFMIEKFFN